MPTQLALTELRIAFNPGLDLATSLAPLGRWGDDGLDRWDGDRLVRTVRLTGAVVPYSGVVIDDETGVALQLALPERYAPLSAEVEYEVRATFVDFPESLASLTRADASVGRLLRLYPGIRPVLFPDPLTALIRSISTSRSTCDGPQRSGDALPSVTALVTKSVTPTCTRWKRSR